MKEGQVFHYGEHAKIIYAYEGRDDFTLFFDGEYCGTHYTLEQAKGEADEQCEEEE